MDGITLALDGAKIQAVNTAPGGITLNAVNQPAIIGRLDAAAGAITLNSGIFHLSASDVIADSSSFVVGGTFDLKGFDETVAGLSGAGTITNTDLTTLSTFTVGANDGGGTFTGKLQGHLTLTKIGAGNLILSGTDNSYDGGTTIAGTFQLDGIGGIASDAKFNLAGGMLALNLPGAATPLDFVFFLSADSTIDVPMGKTITLTAALTGPGGLTKSGAGTLVLVNELNTFGGPKFLLGLPVPQIKIIGGTLQVATDGALGDVGNDVLIDNATFAASATFASGRYFRKSGSVANIRVDGSSLSLINKAIVRPSPFTETGTGDLFFTIQYARPRSPVPDVPFPDGTKLKFAGNGDVTVHLDSSDNIDAIEMSGADSTTKLVIIGPATGFTTINRIIIDDGNIDPNSIISIGSIVIGENVRLGDGLRDSVPELYVEGKVGKVQLYDLNQYALIDLGEGLPYEVLLPNGKVDKTQPSTKTNSPALTLHEVRGPGVVIDLTPSDLALDAQGHPFGGGGLGKVVVNEWDFSGPATPNPGLPGIIRTTQSIASFKLLTGNCSVVFEVDKLHVGANTVADIPSMKLPDGSWGSSGSEIEGTVGFFSATAFLAGATLKVGGLGLVTLTEGGGKGFAGTIEVTGRNSTAAATFTVASDFTGRVNSALPIKSLNVKGNFAGDLKASSIGAITAYSFKDDQRHEITSYDPAGLLGSLGTLTAIKGVVRNFTIVTDQAFKGFNVKLSKLTGDTVGIDNVHIRAASIGNITVSLAAKAGANDIDLTGIRDSKFITTGTGTTNTANTTIGSIGNVTVTLTGVALAGVTGSGNATGIESSTFDALVTANEFELHPAASTVNPLGKIAVKVTGHGGTSVGLDRATFSANSIGAVTVSVSKGTGGIAAHAIETATFTATAPNPALSGTIGALTFDGDATEAQVQDLKVSADANVGAVTVKAKAPAFGTLDASAILAGQALDLTGSAVAVKLARATLGAVNVTGSILNTKLLAGGSIGAVTTGRDLSDSLILAGAKLGGDFVFDNDATYQRTAAIAAITVRGAFARTSIAAGVNPGANGVFGDNINDTAATNLPGTSSIGPIILATAGTTSNTGNHQYGIQAAAINSLKIGASPAVRVGSDSDLFIDGIGSDDVIVRLR